MIESRRGQNKELWGEVFDNTIWQSIVHLGKKFSLPAGTIIRHNQYHGVFYIRKGRVCISYFSKKGKEIKALYYDAGSIFNEARTFSILNPEGAFTCIEDCELYFFSRDMFKSTEFIKKYPQIIQNLLSTMGEKILIHYYTLTNLRAETDLINVAKFIYQLYEENKELRFKIAYNQQDIADILGVHRTTVARSLKTLKEYNIIQSCSHYEVVISDAGRLKILAEDGVLEQED